jgi:hypothetical protein
MQLSSIASLTVGQGTTVSVVNTDGTAITWSSATGGSFAPNPSPDSGSSSSSTVYTPAATSDTITATSANGDTTSGDVTASPAGNSGGNTSQLTVLAQAVASLYTADTAGFCSSVGTTGSAANTAVHAFKVAANINVGTGLYEQSTADAVNSYLPAGSAATAGCAGGPSPPTPPQPPSQPPATTGGMPKWMLWLLGLLVAGGVVTLAYWLYKKHKKSGAREKKKRGKKRK